MTTRIRTTESTLKAVCDRGPVLPRVDASAVQSALGADAAPQRLESALAPITLFALRAELIRRMRLNGGLIGSTRPVNIPLDDAEWRKLEDLAAAVSSPDFAPSAGQVASSLLSLSVKAVASEIIRSGSPLAQELAAHIAAERPS